ncbi:DUF2922 domain-containing protein [Sporanaerobacter acetigenes]|uniref:DUF2922 domain-containing protein n=1 Tax=Sporanaerobacter acetigenes DSM 13106 TaxID=1123281 RepID=A0A1M5SUM1_9FIRM|nr:DUF2922 domain-containing protein [Sporanaerobacter acetigenes]SHH42130.1 Protein of unknown function [Sporanaerobacter acetigenes DSM 13106]
MDKTKLELNFKNASEKKVNIAVDNPREDATKEEIKQVMDTIVAKNIFYSNGGDIVEALGARIVTTSVEDIVF